MACFLQTNRYTLNQRASTFYNIRIHIISLLQNPPTQLFKNDARSTHSFPQETRPKARPKGRPKGSSQKTSSTTHRRRTCQNRSRKAHTSRGTRRRPTNHERTGAGLRHASIHFILETDNEDRFMPRSRDNLRHKDAINYFASWWGSCIRAAF